jgi:predicted GH43/DUF377 family glycosyl hydrolase
MIDVRLHRLGTVMEPQPDNPLEAEGVLNPAAVRGRDGELYLFPRLVARGNYSRIGIARVRFNDAGDPVGVERLGVALEPEAEYERRPDGGGCEDPRITLVEAFDRYVMTYTAFSPRGPRIAVAVSEDLFDWRRLGLATFLPYDGIAFEGVNNKDAALFPVTISDPSGQPALAMLHRPLFPGTRPEETKDRSTPRLLDLERESIWISYCPKLELCHFTSHHRLAAPIAPWERLKIGVGSPPLLTRHGWLLTYHGVGEGGGPAKAIGRALRYSAGMMMLSEEHPHDICYRSSDPILAPETPAERRGAVDHVVFPTGIDRRDDLGMPDRFDLYYGMADSRIGVARIDLPGALPMTAVADPPGGVC